MRIAPHHIKGTPQAAIIAALGQHVDYTPMCPWPDDCTVQWGNGIIPANPFFEAFPAGTFIRGDGETIEDAEREAFAKYELQIGCDHLWGRHHPTRGTYTNGLGCCRRCGRTEGTMFSPIFQLGEWRKPLVRWEADWATEEIDDEITDAIEAREPGYRARCERQKRILRIRKHLFGVAVREGHGTERPVIDGDRSRDSQKQGPSTPQGEAK